MTKAGRKLGILFSEPEIHLASFKQNSTSQSMNLSIKKLLFAVFVLVVILSLFAGARLWLDGETELSRLKLPDGSELRFTVDNYHDEGGRPILWQRYVDSTPQGHRHAIGYCDPNRVHEADFQITATKDGDLVVVHEQRNPDVVLGFIEFSTATQYPGNGEPPWDEYYASMNQIIEKVRNENPERTFILSHQVPGGSNLLVR